MTMFELETYQNEFLPAGGAEVHAVVEVSAAGGGRPPALGPEAAEIIMIDTSGSMAGRKLRAAKAATSAAIDCIRDGVRFGVVAGSSRGESVYPWGEPLAVASDRTRRAAQARVKELREGGGTAMSTWLDLAHHWFTTAPGAICHAILLTDGANESETPEDLEAALRRVEGAFQCDCRGVGADWRVAELRMIASALLGTVDIVAEPADMTADFEAVMRQAMAKWTTNVSLRVWTPRGATLDVVKQVAPTIEDLSGCGVRVDDRSVDFPTGAWADETREYHLRITVPPQAVDEQQLVGRVSLVVDGEAVSQSLIKAIWTDDEARSTRIDKRVAHYTGQVQLAGCIADGLAARRRGDDSEATFQLGQAVRLANDAGDAEQLRRLAAVVEIEDATTGTIRLKKHVAAIDEMTADVGSTKTMPVRKA
jgi:von Willebrand factor type A C-terminal domain/von Willebrand factor type A domain